MIILKIKTKSKEQGITLIALVITIIVLLILAGVTINLTLKEGGIFGRAQIAAKNYMEAQEKELEELGKFENTVNDTINNVTLRISDEKGLKDFASEVNGGKSFAGETIVLQSDIDLDEENWTPIGSEEHPFAGTFDGGGHKINNLTIDSEAKNIGLFGYSTGTIKNIGIETGTINVNGIANTGAICGHSIGLIEGCYNKANIECVSEGEMGYSYTGGIVGVGTGNCIIRNCFNEGEVSCETTGYVQADAGGITAAGGDTTTISCCYNSGLIKLSGSAHNPMVSGIGMNCKIVEYCYDVGSVEIEFTKGDWPAIGGICGQGGGKGTGIVRNCFTIGKMIYNADSWKLGDRAGYICGYYSGKIENCFYKTSKDSMNVDSGVGQYYKNGESTLIIAEDVGDVSADGNWEEKLIEISGGKFLKGSKDYPVLYWEGNNKK